MRRTYAHDLVPRTRVTLIQPGNEIGPMYIAPEAQVGVSNGPIQFMSARKIWPLLELLAKITRVLACSCSQKFCNCSHADSREAT